MHREQRLSRTAGISGSGPWFLQHSDECVRVNGFFESATNYLRIGGDRLEEA
jgi:hypothetical protein